MLYRCLVALTIACPFASSHAIDRPNIVLVMADDQGWGQTGYYNHPVLKTPHLDAMANAGLRLDRYYAAAPVCSPTRASVFTGRTNRRTGVESHGYALRLQEKTVLQAVAGAGYATGHFGKWHLNGIRGPGVPILRDDSHNPTAFGFADWLSVTNFFDLNPIMSRNGTFEEKQGDSSEIIVDEALKFIGAQAKLERPSFTVIWYGTPHSPFRALEQDAATFGKLNDSSQQHYGELVAMDRSIGTLRSGLRKLGIAENTLVWFTSDNGGLPKIEPPTTGGLRGNKGSMYEGGLRVPGIIEWPAGIAQPRTTQFPCVAMDIFPTVADILDLPDDVLVHPIDGISLKPLMAGEVGPRETPLVFSSFATHAINDNGIKLIHFTKKQQYELYDLGSDKAESQNLYSSRPDLAAKMKAKLDKFVTSLNASVAGKDYPEGKVNEGENPSSRFWTDIDGYRPHFDAWKDRPEYASRLQPKKPKPVKPKSARPKSKSKPKKEKAK